MAAGDTYMIYSVQCSDGKGVVGFASFLCDSFYTIFFQRNQIAFASIFVQGRNFESLNIRKTHELDLHAPPLIGYSSSVNERV